MLPSKNRLAWLKSGLFWRTFFLLGFLITLCMIAWVASLRLIERKPKAQQLAAQIVSVVTITRAALTYSAPDKQRELIRELDSDEGIRIFTLEASDKIEPPIDSPWMPIVQHDVRVQLGGATKFASKVNDTAGFWVSFNIDEDEYWLRLERERIERVTGLQWIGWAGVVLLLSLVGAVFITRLINLPLARLTNAARAIAKGQPPELLPESGPTEIIEANRSFNQMVDDLNQIESDRALILAGISHDLRTPLARMQLEIEMAHLADDARLGMQADIAQMDEIIGQFLDYAKPADSTTLTVIDISHVLENCAQTVSRVTGVQITTTITQHIHVLGNLTDLKRVIHNLIENSRRYGKTGDTGIAEIDITCHTEHREGIRYAIINITDHGIGVPDSEMERLLKPFSRMDTARGQANGAGLGLAIVDRVVRRHGGKLYLSNRANGGLAVQIVLIEITETM